MIKLPTKLIHSLARFPKSHINKTTLPDMTAVPTVFFLSRDINIPAVASMKL